MFQEKNIYGKPRPQKEDKRAEKEYEKSLMEEDIPKLPTETVDKMNRRLKLNEVLNDPSIATILDIPENELPDLIIAAKENQADKDLYKTSHASNLLAELLREGERKDRAA